MTAVLASLLRSSDEWCEGGAGELDVPCIVHDIYCMTLLMLAAVLDVQCKVSQLHHLGSSMADAEEELNWSALQLTARPRAVLRSI